MPTPFLENVDQRGRNPSLGKNFTSPTLRGYAIERPECGRNVTVTAICDFLYCSKYAYLRHVERFVPTVTSYSSRALFQHDVFVRLLGKIIPYRDNWGKSEISLASFIQYGLEVAEAEYSRLTSLLGMVGAGHDEEISLIKNKIVEAGKRFFASCRLDEDKKRQIEVFFSAPRIGISGARIDVLDGNYLVEVKAGKALAVNPFHLLQVAWYALIIESSLGIDVDSAEIFFVSTLTREKVSIDNALRLWAIKVREDTAKAMEMEMMPSVQCNRKSCFLSHYCQGSEYVENGNGSAY